MSLLGGLLSGLGVGVKELVETVVEVLRVVATVIEKLAISLGLMEEDEKVEELGDKALQASEELKPEQFPTYKEYLEAIRNFELDPEKSKQFTEQQKLERGMEIITEVIEEKFDVKMKDFMKELYDRREFFTPVRLEKYLEVFAEAGKNLNQVSQYLDGKLSKLGDRQEVDRLMMSAEKKLAPERSDQELGDFIDQQVKKR